MSQTNGSADPKTVKPQVGRPRAGLPADGHLFAVRLALNVRRLRRKRGLNAVEAAQQAGIPKTTWYRVEAGRGDRVAGENIDTLAAYFQVDVSELLRAPRKGS